MDAAALALADETGSGSDAEHQRGISVAPGTRRHTTPPMAGKDPAALDCSPARRARVLLPEQAAP